MPSRLGDMRGRKNQIKGKKKGFFTFSDAKRENEGAGMRQSDQSHTPEKKGHGESEIGPVRNNLRPGGRSKNERTTVEKGGGQEETG